MVLRFDELGGSVAVLDVGDGFGVHGTAVGGGADPGRRVLIEARRAVLVGLGLDNAVEEDAGAIGQDERVGGGGEAGDTVVVPVETLRISRLLAAQAKSFPGLLTASLAAAGSV